MKRYLLLILIIGAPYFSSSAQNLTYQQVGGSPGLTPSLVIDRANQWAVSAFQNYQSVVQLREADLLVLNGNFKTEIQVAKYLVPITFSYQLRIKGKDTRYGLTVDNIQRSAASGSIRTLVTDRQTTMKKIDGNNLKPKLREQAIQQMESEFKILDDHFARLFAEIQAAIFETSKKDDW